MKKQVLALLVLSLVMVVSPAGCYNSLIENVTWVMESYGDPDNLAEALDNAEFTLYLDSAEGEFSGSIGVNTYYGKYQLNGNELLFPDKTVGVTQLYVGEEIQQQQEAYFHILMNADKCEMVRGKLHVTSDDGVIIYKKK